MTLQDLKYFIALAGYLHFGQAAKACFVSQPTLSIAIQKLEEELKLVLFERYKSSVKLTKLGMQLLEQAKKVIAETKQLEAMAAYHQDPLRGTFKLGCILTVGPYLLPGLVANLTKIAPHMPLELQEDFTEHLKHKLMQGELDAIIVAEPFTLANTLKKQLYEEKFLVLLPKSHPLSQKKMIKPQHFMGENLMLLGKGHCFRDQVLKLCPNCYFDQTGQAGIQATTFEGASLETIRHMVISGRGLTILPETAANIPAYLKAHLAVVPLHAQDAKRKIVIAWREQFPRLKAVLAIQKAAEISARHTRERSG